MFYKMFSLFDFGDPDGRIMLYLVDILHPVISDRKI